jgi:hypothetical protein
VSTETTWLDIQFDVGFRLRATRFGDEHCTSRFSITTPSGVSIPASKVLANGQVILDAVEADPVMPEADILRLVQSPNVVIEAHSRGDVVLLT